MMRTLQAVAIVATILTSAVVGFVAGVVLMAQGEAQAPAEPPPNRWERSI